MRCVLAALVAVVLTPYARAGEASASGNWKFSIVEDGQLVTPWLIILETNKGATSGKTVSMKGYPPASVKEARIEGNLLQLQLAIDTGRGTQKLSFEGKLPAPGGKKIFGTLSNRTPALMEATTASSLFELQRELVERTPSDPRVFSSVLDLIGKAKAEKTAVKDVQTWADIALRASENYPAAWNGDYSLRLLETLSGDFPELAVAMGQKMEAGLDPKASVVNQIRLLSALVAPLKKTGKDAEAKQLEVRVDKLEGVAYAEYLPKSLDFKVDAFAGRKGKSNRAVLVELFTGGQCPPCVAADVAFDAVEKSYKPADVVLLQYHLHIPGADPLTNPVTEERQEYYGGVVRGTPAILFNGKAAAPGGGGREAAKEKFQEYQSVINPLLEKDASVKLSAQASRKGDKVTIQAKAQDLETPGNKISLRLVLVEDWVRYKSPNGLSYHHRVVRAMPGGAKGTPLTKKDGEVSHTVDIGDLQVSLGKYLDDFARKDEPFPDSQRPLRMRNLHVVAFVQDDATAEILQAVDVPVRDE